jgi:hypothetical protein
MSESYFVADDKIPITQQSIAIPSENGLSYNSTQTIEIKVPPTTKFVNPKQSVLQFNVQITPDANACMTRLQLDAEIGAQILIKDIRIYDGNRNTLLEEITDYNTMVAMKYDYNTNKSLRNKRALTEGTTTESVFTRGSRGSSDSCCNDVINNPYFKPKETPGTTTWTSSDFLNAKVNLPLHTGLFQNDKILPIMLLDGLHISITLEDNYRVFRQMDGVLKGRRTTLNPIFLGTNGSTSGSLANGSSATTWHLSTENNMHSVANVPFVVGEQINFFDTANNRQASFTGSVFPKITEISACATTSTIMLTTQSVENATGHTIVTDGSYVVYSKSVEIASSYDATYSVSNVNLILQEVMMPSNYESSMLARMKEGGSLSYDFLSVTNYRYSQLVSDRVANIRIPINNSRCKSILCVPTDAEVYSQKQLLLGDEENSQTYKVFHNNTRDFHFHSGRSGMVGIADHISNYVFMYDGRLQPSRNVNCSKTGNKVSLAQQPLIELDKALVQAGINTHSMRKYNENFVIGRALSLGSGVYDARNKDFNLQVNYQEDTAPSKPKLWKNYVFHLRRLVIKGDTIMVEV